MDRLSSAGILVSRILLSSIFLLSGALKIPHFAETQAAMAARGMKMTALFLAAATVVEIAGGLFVLLGYRARLGALALFLYLIPVTIVFHRVVGDPGQAAQLLKNLAIMGGLAAIVSVGPGEFSVRRGSPGPRQTPAGR